MGADVLPTAPTHEIKYFIFPTLLYGSFFKIGEKKAIYILQVY